MPRLEHYLGSVAEALRNIGFLAETRVTGPGPAQTITSVAESEGCDLILMATRGRDAPGLDIEVGSVTEQVVQSAQCPVFAVTGFHSTPAPDRGPATGPTTGPPA